MAKRTKAEKERIAREQRAKYRAVKNYYGDSAFAQKAKSWSNERFIRETGLQVPKYVPKQKKPPKESTVKRRYAQLERFQLAYVEHDFQEAKYLKRYSKAKIESSNELARTLKYPLSANAELKRRSELWKKWSIKKNKAMPPRLLEEAHRINRTTIDKIRGKRFDENDHYGFAIVNFGYLYQRDTAQLQKEIDPPKDYNDSPKFHATRRR